MHEATAARGLIEQAKGVLSELHVLNMEQAAARLEQLASSEQLAQSEAARAVIHRASTRQS